MQPALADVVHAVILRGLDLKKRLEEGDSPSLDVEQAVLKDLLLAESETARVPEYGPDRERPRGKLDSAAGAGLATGKSDFAGVRYALVCWLDELFTQDDSDWSSDWNEQKLEVELYGSNDRSWRFWQQAQLAQSRGSDDALEAFYLCVMLGFRGDLRNHDEQLRRWAGSARHRLGQITEIEWPYASQLNVPVPAQPLRGRRRLRRMVMVACLTLVAVVPSIAFLLVWKVGH
jgi:type VI secretion system protein ImpK